MDMLLLLVIGFSYIWSQGVACTFGALGSSRSNTLSGLGYCHGLWDEGEEPHQQCAFLLQERCD